MTTKLSLVAFLGCVVTICLVTSLAQAGMIVAHINVTEDPVGDTGNAATRATVISQTPGADLRPADKNGVPNHGDLTLFNGLDPFFQADGVLLATASTIAIPDGNERPRAVIEVPGDLTGPNAFTPGLWLSLTDITGGGRENNFPVTLAYFPFADGWIAGHVGETGELLGGNTADVTVTPLISPVDVGRFTLTIGGVNPTDDGVLFAIGGENSNSGNYITMGILDDNTGWDVRLNDQGLGFSSFGELGEFSFVFVPYATQNLVAGRIADDGTILTTNAPGAFTVTPQAIAGEYLLTIPGKTIDDGMLLLQVTELVTANDTITGGEIRAPEDNFLVYEYRDDLGGFLVKSLDLPGATDQTVTWTFAFIEYGNPLDPNPIPEPGSLVLFALGVLMMAPVSRRCRRRRGG